MTDAAPAGLPEGWDKGTQVVMVRDGLLAAAMLTVGIPLRNDPPYTHVQLASGEEQITFNFEPICSDGKITAKECVEAWTADLNWVKQNPYHPFAYAMTAVRNYIQIREHCRKNVPLHCYQMPPDEQGRAPVLFVKAGTEKERLAIAKGYQQI